jgi:hypothetical protein
MGWNNIKIDKYFIFVLQHETSKHQMQHCADSDQVLCLQRNENWSTFMLNRKIWKAYSAIKL